MLGSPEESQVEGKEIPRQTILIVDDNDQNTNAAMQVFSGIKGVNVTYVPDRKTALESLAKNKYDTLISDLNMPDATGTGNKEAGIESTFEIISLFQKKLLSNDTERGRLEEGEGFDSSEFTREEFDELFSSAKEIRNAFKVHKNDEAVEEELSFYEKSGEGGFLAQAFGNDRNIELLGLQEQKEHLVNISRKVSNKFGNWGSHIIEAVTSLASPDEAHQPLGWKMADHAKNNNMKYLILTSEEHSGYGSGIQNMLSMIFELGNEGAFAGMKDKRGNITENTKFVIGDKRKPEVWQKATSALLANKK